MKLDTRSLALVIADAVDLVGVDDLAHGKRVGIMARECARILGYGNAVGGMLFEAGLIHDCGVSSTKTHRILVTELDWSGAQEHCELGHRLIRSFAPLAHLAPILHYHHTHWKDIPRLDIAPDIARHANLIYLVDRVDMLTAPYYAENQQLFHADEIRERIAQFSGDFFSPELVEAFLAASRAEAFWLLLTPANIATSLQNHGPSAGALGLRDLRDFAAIIAHIVDAKSHFTVEHSQGVARLARYLAELMGLPGESCEKIEIAALLHDIGKLQIPDEILEKPSTLNPAERAMMKSHSFVTQQILMQIEGIEDIARWASYHHESLDGGGYPFRLRGDEISMEARIIRVADVFQAMAQNRPYRASTPPADILALLRKMQAAGQIDGKIVDLVDANLAHCHRIALRP
jgi:putative nucleotidyltransferase with HDIG domain